MNKYLVIGFDRYETERSSHRLIEAASPEDAAAEMYDLTPAEFADEGIELIHVDNVFSCEPGEESDLLIYKV